MKDETMLYLICFPVIIKLRLEHMNETEKRSCKRDVALMQKIILRYENPKQL